MEAAGGKAPAAAAAGAGVAGWPRVGLVPIAQRAATPRPPPPPTHTHACAAAPRQFSKRVERLRKICRQATVAIPPTVYRNKDDDALVAALEALLDKHGVSTHAGAARS